MSALRVTRQLTRNVNTRNFSVAVRLMAEGDAGAPRSGGAAQGDAFTKREQASENKYVHDQELKKLQELKQRIAEKEADLAKDRKEVESLNKK